MDWGIHINAARRLLLGAGAALAVGLAVLPAAPAAADHGRDYGYRGNRDYRGGSYRDCDDRRDNRYSRSRWDRRDRCDAHDDWNYDRGRRSYGRRKDFDRDGIPNRWDRDRDGDHVRNRYDRSPNNPYRR
jgi:hypothetical protein